MNKMPYCKVDSIRLCCSGDPRAEHCGDFIDKDGIIMRDHQIDCTLCTGYCDCDHPTWQGFTMKIEKFDEQFDVNEIAQVLRDHFDERCGVIEVQEGIDSVAYLM